MQANLEQSISGLEIEEILSELSAKRSTGELIITAENKQWSFYFIMGYLRYATGGNHRARRWYRSIKQHCPELFPIKLNEILDQEPWEYQLLRQSLNGDLITTVQAKEVINSSIKEVLFNLINTEQLIVQWLIKKQPTTTSSLLIKTKEVVDPVKESLMRLPKNINLSKYNAELSPVFKESVASKVTTGINKFFQGKHTLWDISVEAKRPISDIIQVLLPFDRQGVLELKDINDLESPVNSPKDDYIPETVKLLVACIDDSSAICHALERIITPAGYKVLKIQKPLEEMSLLVKEKPDLIFLDLMMPEVNGNNLCNFLRQTQAFQKTPIIILTSSKDSVDRMMTEIAGATDFLNKPPEEERVLEILKKYLPN